MRSVLAVVLFWCAMAVGGHAATSVGVGYLAGPGTAHSVAIANAGEVFVRTEDHPSNAYILTLRSSRVTAESVLVNTPRPHDTHSPTDRRQSHTLRYAVADGWTLGYACAAVSRDNAEHKAGTLLAELGHEWQSSDILAVRPFVAAGREWHSDRDGVIHREKAVSSYGIDTEWCAKHATIGLRLSRLSRSRDIPHLDASPLTAVRLQVTTVRGHGLGAIQWIALVEYARRDDGIDDTTLLLGPLVTF